MAEFKLGRIKFVWRGEWSASTSYVVDDVVSNGGQSYICVVSHTSDALFATDFDYIPTKWNLVSGGTAWRGDWAISTYYNSGDLVKYGGIVYVCTAPHTSADNLTDGLEIDSGKWDPFAASLFWKDAWANDTRYKVNDLVYYGGITYVCNEAHTSAEASLELDVTGASGDTTTATLTFATQILPPFNVGSSITVAGMDPAGYNGTVTVTACTTTSVSFASAEDGAFATGGTVTGTSQLGLELDLEKWDSFNRGIVYLGDWADTVRYKINDVVKYGASTWICTSAHTSTTDFDETKFSIFTEGLQFENSWSDATEYQVGDVVNYGGYSYIAKQNHTNQNPVTETAYWEIYTTGFNLLGDWSDSTDYKVGDVVRLGGYTYLAINDNTNQVPPNASYWSKLNSGEKWKGTSATYTAVDSVAVSSNGLDATFDVTRSGTVYDVVLNDPGSDYVDGDTIKILGSDLGGLSPANDITIAITTATAGEIDTFTWSGISVTWDDTTDYVLGDLVLWGVSTYICVQGHTSSSLNRPDADTTAEYWNLFAAGAESSILTTEGDTYYFGAQGPTRLPIGTDGQILRVRGGYPSWAYYGVINNLVYVAPTGVDDIAVGRGLTIDRPWKTVRFATDQINAGYQNRNAKALLEKNKQFMMKEVTNWITYTYTVNIASSSSATNYFTCNSTANLTAGMPIEFSGTTGGVTAGTKYFVKVVNDDTTFSISDTQGGLAKVLSNSSTPMTGTLSYDRAFCERDTGYLVDALAFDLGHGGNGKSTIAAKAYYTPAGSAYINSNFGQQITQTVAAYNYLKTLAVNVLSNKAPALNYQQANGETSPVDQIIDTTLTAEDGTTDLSVALLGIVTDGLLAGTGTAIKAAIFPNTTVSVKTGTFFEVLPITVPNYTAIVGDELRGTVINPQPAISLLVNDKPKTISALDRIKSVVPNLISNVPVSSTTGNTVTQQFNYINYESISSESVDANVATIVDIVANDTTPSFTFTDPVEYDSGYSNARDQLDANRDFIIDEITEWIAAQVAGPTAPFAGDFTYDSVACARDVGYILDALKYDITYGGNLETLVAARAYYSYGAATFGTGEKEETLAALAHLKDVIGYVIDEDTVWSPSTALVQDTSGTAGSAGSITFAQDRIQDIYDTIDNDGTLPSEILPSTSWVSPRLVSANTTLQSQKTALRAACIDWITFNYPDLTFDQDTCSRDIGYIIDALGYDMMFGSNFRSIKAGMSYRRGIASALTVIADQLDATTGVIKYLGNALQDATKGTATVTANLTEMADILANGLTAVPTFVLPTPTGGTGNASDSGYYNAARLVYANKAFLQAEVSAWIDAQIAGSTPPFNGFVYAGTDRTKCERDVGYIVDALRYDLTYGGNLATVIAARSYYSNGVLVEVGEEDQAKAVQLYLQSIIDNIVQGDNAGWTKTPANTETQVVSGTAGSAGAATFAQARIQEIHDTIDTGTSPTTIAPDVTWTSSDLQTSADNIDAGVDQIKESAIAWVNDTFPYLVYSATTCARDVGYMVDALKYDLLFGSNFLSSWNAMSYYRGITSTDLVLQEQLNPTLGILGFVGSAVKERAYDLTGFTGNLDVSNRIDSGISTIYDIVNDGLGAEPTEIITDPTNLDVDYANARVQIAQNYAFIKADVSKYLELNYSSIWSGLGAEGQAACQRDVGYLLDAIRYDLTYGGNTQSLIAGSSYYTYINLVIDETELTATLAAYAHLKSIIGTIAQNDAVTAQAGNLVSQVRSGTGDITGDAATFAENRVQDIFDWIDNGTAPAAIAPNTDWVDPNLLAGFNELQTRKTEIQSDGLGFVNKFYQELSFNETTCSRDIGYMVDAIGYDAMFNSNFASIIVGRSYNRAIESAQLVLADQKKASLGLVNFLKYKIKGFSVGGAISKASKLVNDISDYIHGGAVPRFSWPEYTGIDAENFAAAKLIWENKEFITQELIAYIYENYPSLEYSKYTCARDVGYIVDALRYDLTYGGNYASKQAGISYYSRLTSAFEISASEKTATLDAYDVLKTIVQDIAQGGTSYTAISNATRIDGTSGDATSATVVGGLVDVITNIIDLGIDSGVPQVTITDIASGTTFTTSDAHGLAVGDEVIPQTTANGLTAGVIYYVKTVPASDEFTLTDVYAGTVISSFTDGTGLSLVAEITDLPSVSWVSSSLIAVHTLLSANRSTIQSQITTFITENYPNLDYDSATCERDVGYIVDAIGYDLMLGTNFRSVKAGMSYYQAQASLVVGDQKRATLQSFRELKTILSTYANSVASVLSSIRQNMSYIIDILDKGVGTTPEIHGSLGYMNDLATVKSANILLSNKDFLAAESSSWIRDQYSSIVTEVSGSPTNVFTTSTSHGFVVGDPVEITSVAIPSIITEVATTGNLVTFRSTDGFVENMRVVITGSGLGSLTAGTNYYIKTVESSTQVTLTDSVGGTVIDPGIATGIITANVGGAWGGISTGTIYYVESVPSTTTFTLIDDPISANQIQTSTDEGYMVISYYFDDAACKRDMAAYVEAIAYDMIWPGNYKSTMAAMLYNNAVSGSERSDMFWVSNSTGLRNCTLRGLVGDLTEENDYGTKRPTAGAFVALNPGFGPNDENVWVSARSHYSQNVTMFGTGCSGAKIDSALHAGGNKSMVKNDFTTIISDGFGVWCTGADSLTELVSVFNYYGYAGYIAEKGGRIRATNGNSSYGTYGVIAEGVSSKETPLYCNLNNRGAEAQITTTVTDGVMEVLRFEFSNAGSNYTNAAYTINGSGYNAEAIGDEFRDGALFETRIIDPDTGDDVGGTSYSTASNAAQTGDTTSITIAATDQALSAAYVGMRIQITAGTGVGQYANIATYNTGSKIATVVKPSTGDPGWDHIVPGTPIESALDLTTTYIIEPAIEYTAPGYATSTFAQPTGSWKSLIYGDGLYVSVADSSTSTTYSTSGSTWSTAGALTTSANWVDLAYGGGFGATATAIVGGLGGRGAQLQAVLGVANTTGAATADQIARVEILDGGQGYSTPPVIIFTPVSGGVGAKATAKVLDGKIVDVIVDIPGSGYNLAPTVSVATDRITKIIVNSWGRGYTGTPQVTISGGGGSSAVAEATVSNEGVSRIMLIDSNTLDEDSPSYLGYSGSGYTSTPTVEILDTGARFVAIANGSTNVNYTTTADILAGNAWTASAASGKSNLKSIAYGNGYWLAVGGTNEAVRSATGDLWTNSSIPTLGAGTYSAVAFGNETFVAISTGNNATAISTNGSSWTAGGTLPSSTTWTSVAYGNGRFVAIASGGTEAAYSYDKGVTWYSSNSGLPSSTLWTSVGYGQGLFFAIASGTGTCATSPDGVEWTSRSMPATTAWSSVAFGNTDSNPLWVAVSSTSGANGANIRTGATAQGRVKVASGAVTEIRMTEPGSGYPKGTVSATTASTDLITVDQTINLIDGQPVEFFGTSAGGLVEEQTYYVIGSTITSTQFKVSDTVGSSTPVSLEDASITGMTYRAGPIATLTDPSSVQDAVLRVRMGDGALGNPSFPDRGADNATANSDVDGDGYSDLFQVSTFVNVYGLSEEPTPGANVEFASLPGAYYKLVTITNFVEDQQNPGTYTATFQLNPGLTTLLAPRHGDRITTRLSYSQVRLTGHDYLYIGTGNFDQTNYPYVDITQAIQSNQELFSGGGRVFFTSTDQDGNFNVGDLFGVQQATGTATLNASAFNLSGLNSLQLGAVELGIGSAIITQFSTDPFFTADSDNIVPTQRAIRSYITAQIGGGQSSLNVNTLTSGVVYIAGNSISTTTGVGINVTSKMNFTGGIDGAPVALGYFLTR